MCTDPDGTLKSHVMLNLCSVFFLFIFFFLNSDLNVPLNCPGHTHESYLAVNENSSQTKQKILANIYLPSDACLSRAHAGKQPTLFYRRHHA